MFGANPVFTTTIICFYIVGFLCAAFAILRARTPQGASAWVIGLITLPFITVPLFLFFGRSKFYGYTNRRKQLDKKVGHKLVSMQDELIQSDLITSGLHPLMQSLSKLCAPGFTSNNKIDLLIDGEKTYSSMLTDLEKAQKFIIFQFYVFRADSAGRRFAEVLMRKSREGVTVYFLYDEIGTEIPDDLLKEMHQSGMNVCHFNSFSGRGRFQINFRNHRKVIIVDGEVAFIGGLNIGNDYLGLWPELGPWRDTHLRMEGPSVITGQISFAKDWYWCKEEELKTEWKIKQSDGDANILVLPSGPADDKQACLLAHIAMVNAAKERLWIANPYLVPPESLLDAILLAALRGVDVRFIVPAYSDAKIVMMASKVYISRLLKHGVKVFRYQAGFLHQKVMLVDDLFAVVGSANLDFRSMFINFEITVVAQDAKLVKEVEAMLQKDFVGSEEIQLEEYENVGLWKKITSRGANLLAPML